MHLRQLLLATGAAALLLATASAEPTAPEAPPATDIVDTHLHAYSVKPDGLDHLVKWMDRNGISTGIVHPLTPSRANNPEQRQAMLANYAKYRGRLYRFCIFRPEEVSTLEEAVTRLKQEKADGAIGFGEHYGKGRNFDHPENMRIYKACGMVGLPVMFHTDNKQNMDKPGLPHLEAALKAHPDCTFIAHGPFWWKQMGTGTLDRLLGAYPNLYADISAGSGARAMSKDLDYTRKFMTAHNTKLMFATDCGWWTYLSKTPRATPQFKLMTKLNLPAEAENNIYRGTAQKLFGFSTKATEAQK